MKKLVLVFIVILMGSSLSMAHPRHSGWGPVMGFGFFGFAPAAPVGVYVYFGAPIVVGPGCPSDDWGYYGPVNDQCWGWYYGGYFYPWAAPRPWYRDRDWNCGQEWVRDWGWDHDRGGWCHREGDHQGWDNDHQGGNGHQDRNDHEGDNRHEGGNDHQGGNNHWGGNNQSQHNHGGHRR